MKGCNMAIAQTQPLSPFAEHLVAEGLLVEAQARELADQARADDMPLSLYLENKKWLSATQLAEVTARFYGLPLYNLDVHQTDKMPIEFMSLNIVQKGYAIPLLRQKNMLFFGVADPEPISTNEIAFATGTQVKLVIVETNKLQALATDMREAQMVAGLENIGESALQNLDIEPVKTEADRVLSGDTDDKPIVSYINQLILDAIKIKASDIHFEPFEKYLRVRFRIDGILHEASRSATQSSGPLIARLKILANLDIAEHRLPQDGQIGRAH